MTPEQTKEQPDKENNKYWSEPIRDKIGALSSYFDHEAYERDLRDWYFSKLLDKDKELDLEKQHSEYSETRANGAVEELKEAYNKIDSLEAQISAQRIIIERECGELESQLSKQKELLQETINERNDWVGKYQKERELREAAENVIEKTIAYLESISGKEINYSRFLFDSGNSAYMKYNNLKNQGLIPDAEPALKRNLF